MSRYTLPKLASDGSNWVVYRERMLTILAAKGLMQHVRGIARRPPRPPPFPRLLPHIPASASISTATSAPAAATVSTSASTAGSIAGPGTTGTAAATGTTGGTGATASAAGPGGTATSTAPTGVVPATASAAPPTNDEYSGLTDEEYEKTMERAENKFYAWETKEADTRALIYETLSEDLFVDVKDATTASTLWESVVQTCENKSTMYANAIRTRMQNARCADGGDMRAHLALLQKERENLASIGGRIADPEFTAIITGSIPESYHGRVQSLSDLARLTNIEVSVHVLVLTLNEEYDRRTMGNTTGTDNALATGPLTCYNCGRTGHIKAKCWRPGGGMEGQRPKYPNQRNRSGGAEGGNGSAGTNFGGGTGTGANAVSDTRSEHSLIALQNDTALATGASAQHYIEVYDSGATRHIFPYRERFDNYNTLSPPRAITAANGDQFLAIGEGTVQVEMPNGVTSTPVTLKNVLHAPTTAFALISCKRADESGYSTLIEKGVCSLTHRGTGTIIAQVAETNGLYQVIYPNINALIALVATGDSTAKDNLSNVEFHRIMGHISLKRARDMVDKGYVDGIELRDHCTDLQCPICIQAKITRKPIPKVAQRASAIEYGAPKDYGDRINADSWEPGWTSLGGSHHASLYTDEATKWKEGFTYKRKSGAEDAYRELEARLLTQHAKQIKWLHSDGGGEFIALRQHLKDRGTRFTTSVHDTPEQNGTAERANRDIAAKARAMLIDSALPKTLWPYAFLHAIWVANRTSHSALNERSPFLARFGKPPNLKGLRAFGTRVWVRIEHPGKLDPRARSGVFVGFSQQHKDGILVYWPDKRNVTAERNLVFEDNTPAVPPPDVQSEGATVDASTPDLSAPDVDNSGEKHDDGDIPGAADDFVVIPSDSGTQDINVDDSASETSDHAVVEEQIPEEPSGRGQRIKRPSAKLRDIQRGLGSSDGKLPRGIPSGTVIGAVALVDMSDNIMGAVAALEMRHDATDAQNNRASEEVRAMAIEAGEEPLTLKQAQASEDWGKWEEAIHTEMENLREHGTYDLVEKPPGVNIIGCKFVFRIKRDADGKVEKFKARAVAKGFSQKPGQDFFDTFAPVARLGSVRAIFSIAARNGWDIIQMDVKSAYLNGELDETIYMEQPPGTAKPGEEHLVCRLKKTLYGLRQAGRGWYKTYCSAMTKLDMIKCEADHAVFYRHNGTSMSIVATSVDDLAITGTDDYIAQFRAGIKTHFKMTDIGKIGWILGIEVVRDMERSTLRLAQRSHIDTIVKRLHLEEAKPVSTPLDPGARLDKSQSPTTPEEIADMALIPYREGVGSLMYLAQGTRPDIAFPVHRLSQFIMMSNPGRTHWEALKRVVRYLIGTRELWLEYGNTREGLVGYSDADWGTSDSSRHSVSGYVFTMDGGAVTWSAKKQNVVALSSTEAEYIAITHATKEAIWLRTLLSEVVHPDISNHAVRLYSDNKSAIELAKNNTFHARTKHIDIRFHFIREAIEKEQVVLGYRRTEDMPADAFTKALARAKIVHLQELYGLRSL